jgi:hypothetical protein
MTQLKVRVESGETVTVPGSAFSKIEYEITLGQGELARILPDPDTMRTTLFEPGVKT